MSIIIFVLSRIMYFFKKYRIVCLLAGPAVIVWFVLSFSGILDPIDESQKHAHVIQQRSKDVRDKCLQLSKTDYLQNMTPTGYFFSHDDVTYCKIEKVGCTFWLRVMRFIAGDYPKNPQKVIRKPSDIDRYVVHYYPYKNLIISQTGKPLGSLMLSNSKSFMFARHPFTRLWSAYVDKFVLPDFWIYHAVSLARKLRNADQDVKCVNDVTFEEFVRFLFVKPPGQLDKHFKPIHLMCSPCHVDFDVIGKQETFTADTDYILDTFGLEDIKETADNEQRIRGEIETIVKYNPNLVKPRGLPKCHDHALIFERLWTAFQLNGYIHRSIEFPGKLSNDDAFLENTVNVVLNAIFRAIDSHTGDMKNDLKFQKQTLMVEVFQTLPKELIVKLKELYKYDFELFDYDPDLID